MGQIAITGELESEALDENFEMHTAGSDLRGNMTTLEKRLIVKALEKNKWHRGKTAAELGLTYKTLQRKMRRHGLK